jgi:hypothetical protein
MHHRLPAIDVDDHVNENPTVSSGGSTAAMEAPMCWVEASSGPLFDLARAALLSPAVAPNNSVAPDADESELLYNEGDVSRTTSRYLVYPVNRVLFQLYPHLRGRLRCRNEATQGSGRADMVWTYQHSPANNAVYIALLELKTLFAMSAAEFADARCADWADVQASLNEAQALDEVTLFDGNALKLLKQAAKYSVNMAPDVALFEWLTMFVVDFTTLDPDTGGVEAVWFDERATATPVGRTFRLLLLGFLVRALKRHGVVVCVYAHGLACFFHILRSDCGYLS